MTKHTPGPWHVDGLYVKDACGCYVCDIKLADDDPEPLANARLIAAAPLLLEALRRVIPLIDGEIPSIALDALTAATEPKC